MAISRDASGEVYARTQLTLNFPPGDDTADTFVYLSGNDQLWLSKGESLDKINASDNLFSDLKDLSATHKLLKESNHNGNDILSSLFDPETWYTARILEAEENRFYLSLRREQTGLTAHSYVELPEPFVFDSIDATAISRSNSDITLTWDPVENDVKVRIWASVTCNPVPENVNNVFVFDTDSDSGSYVISAGELSDPTLTGECNTSITVGKWRVGDLAQDFFGGFIQGWEIRSQSFLSDD